MTVYANEAILLNEQIILLNTFQFIKYNSYKIEFIANTYIFGNRSQPNVQKNK